MVTPWLWDDRCPGIALPEAHPSLPLGASWQIPSLAGPGSWQASISKGVSRQGFPQLPANATKSSLAHPPCCKGDKEDAQQRETLNAEVR